MTERTYSLEELKQLGVVGNKAFTPPHGPNGLLTAPGVRPDMYDLTPRVGGALADLPMLKSLDANERFEFFTGVTAQSGTNPNDVCGVPPVSGKLKVGQVNIPYGQFYKATDEMRLDNVGMRIDRSDVNRRVRNPQNSENNPFVPQVNGDYNTWLGKAFIEFGYGAMLDHAYVAYQGDITKLPAATQLGFIKEPNGLDKFIKTGYTDALTAQATPALDSMVVPFAGALDADIVVALSDALRTQMMNAELKRTPNVRWRIIVHPTMKYPLIDLWACNYQTARCYGEDSYGRFDLTRATDLREAMVRGSYLLVDGQIVELRTDAAMPAAFDDEDSTYTSDIFIVPIDDGAGNPLLYWEYLPFDGSNPDAQEINQMSGGEYRAMNNGLYYMTFERSRFCLKWIFQARTRLILERPDLAIRLDDITYTSTVNFLDPNHASPNYRNGGVTARTFV